MLPKRGKKTYVRNAIKEPLPLGLSSQNLMFYFVKKNINAFESPRISSSCFERLEETTSYKGSIFYCLYFRNCQTIDDTNELHKCT